MMVRHLLLLCSVCSGGAQSLTVLGGEILRLEVVEVRLGIRRTSFLFHALIQEGHHHLQEDTEEPNEVDEVEVGQGLPIVLLKGLHMTERLHMA